MANPALKLISALKIVWQRYNYQIC